MVVAALATLAALPRAANAQGTLVEGARAQLEQLNPDSAYRLLERALAPAAGTAGAERVRAFTLLGISELLRGNRGAARQSFEQALRLDPVLRVDSLAELHADTRVVFGEVRAALTPVRQPFVVALDMPADTTVAPLAGQLRLDVRPSARARAVVSVETPTAVLWSDTQTVDITGRVLWGLTGADGVPVPDGRYLLRVTATDLEFGQAAPLIERTLLVERTESDTTPLPPPLDASALLPESQRLARASPSRLVVAALLGAGAALAPAVLGAGDVARGGNGRATLVAGAVSLAGIVGFLSGHRLRPLPENAAYNRELRERDEQRRGTIAAENARRLAAAPLRIRIESPAR